MQKDANQRKLLRQVKYDHTITIQKIKPNQSRICGKGVGSGLFPSVSLEFIKIADIGPYYGLEWL